MSTSKKTLKTILSELEKEELIEVILELSKIDKKNIIFLNVFLQSSDKVNFDEIINNAKNKIYNFIYGKSITGRDSLKLREARNVISETSKIINNQSSVIADLKLYYVETGNSFTNEFGDIDERFYNSMGSMFINFCKDIFKHPELYNIFEIRLKTLFIQSRNIGWGYSDEMGEIYFELLSRLGIEIDI